MVAADYDTPAYQKAGIEYHDTSVEVRGEIVRQMEAVFATDWYYASGQVTRPAGSSAPRTLPAACPSPGFDRPVPFAWFTACITEAVP